MGGGEPASPMENDDLLSEFLLRLPPVPSSLRRASLACKRWLRLVSDQGFLRRFRARHSRDPPLLGFFSQDPRGLSFTPILDPPDRIPSDCLSLPLDKVGEFRMLCCRHGLVLLLLPALLLVWDPSTRDGSAIGIPWGLGFDSRTRTAVFNGAVLRSAGDGDGSSSHFQLVVVSTDEERTRAFVCVFSSETGEWGNPISTACPSMAPTPTPGTLVGRSLYWALDGDSHGILEFDLDKQCLRVIDVTLFLSNIIHYRIWVVPVEGGVPGYLVHSIHHNIQLWKWIADSDGVAGWVLDRSFEPDVLQWSSGDESPVEIVGIIESNNAFLLQTKTGVFMVHIESMQCKKVSEMSNIKDCHSFTSVYTADLGFDDEEDGDEPVH